MRNILFIFVFCLILVLTSSGRVFAQDGTVAATPSSKTVDYALPYPGLLPGHPLYPLKMLRDTILNFLISGPIKKAEFDLQQSDKHMQTTYLLLTQQKKFSRETLTKVEFYFGDAVEKSGQAKTQGIETSELRKKLSLAHAKYQEVLKSMEQHIAKEDKDFFRQKQKNIEKLGEKVKQKR